jgi:response regulator RpfG family c-di-GMP phosphodiesterase
MWKPCPKDYPRSEQLRRKLPGRVLIVDDSPGITSTFSKLSNLLGHDMQIADNGGEALSFAIDQLPDGVFSDLDMPRLTGRSLRDKFARIAEGSLRYWLQSAGMAAWRIGLVHLRLGLIASW